MTKIPRFHNITGVLPNTKLKPLIMVPLYVAYCQHSNTQNRLHHHGNISICLLYHHGNA